MDENRKRPIPSIIKLIIDGMIFYCMLCKHLKYEIFDMNLVLK